MISTEEPSLLQDAGPDDPSNAKENISLLLKHIQKLLMVVCDATEQDLNSSLDQQPDVASLCFKFMSDPQLTCLFVEKRSFVDGK